MQLSASIEFAGTGVGSFLANISGVAAVWPATAKFAGASKLSASPDPELTALVLSFVEFAPTSSDPVFDIVTDEASIVFNVSVVIYRDAVEVSSGPITQTVLDTGILDLALAGEPSGQHAYTAKLRSPSGQLGNVSNTVTITVG